MGYLIYGTGERRMTELPKPEGGIHRNYYTADQMRDYGRAVIAERDWWEKNFEEACQNIRIDCAKLAEQYWNDISLQNKYTISEFILDKNREV